MVPYKFLLYKPGGHFKMHRDTEKEDRMFATMVVQLPFIHEGGDLQVRQTVAKQIGNQAGTVGTAPIVYEEQVFVHDFGV